MMEPNLNKTWRTCIVCKTDFPSKTAIVCRECGLKARTTKTGAKKYENAMRLYKRNCSL